MSLSSVLKRSVSPLSKLNIAIVGNVASGKTTVANIIFDTLKDQVECIQPCRELVANKYNSFANFFADVMVHALQDDQTYQKKDIRLCNRYFDSV